MAKEEIRFIVRGVDMLFDMVELVIKIPPSSVLTSCLEIDTLFLFCGRKAVASLFVTVFCAYFPKLIYSDSITFRLLSRANLLA